MAYAVFPLHLVEERFDREKVYQWLRENWTLSLYANVVYVTVIFLGRRWMRDKKPYSLRRALAMWNTGLAVFSIYGFLSLYSLLRDSVMEHGFAYTTCNNALFTTRIGGLWGLLFAMSKVVEFGDTIFIVMRKTPLNFLHWYHHVTVCAYSCFTVAYAEPAAEWFGMANLLVHSFMYSYYVLKANGVKIPRAVAQSITILQLAQFGLGLVVLAVTFLQKRSGHTCTSRDDAMWAGIVMYASYMVLFANFFYQRYIRHK